MKKSTDVRLAVRCCRVGVCLVVLCLTAGQRDVGAQVAPTATDSATKAPAAPPTPKPIEAADIPSRAAAAAAFARGAVVAIAQQSKGILGLDSEPLWKALFDRAGPAAAREAFEALWQDRWRTLKKYVTDSESHLPLWALVLLALVVAARSLRRRSEDWVRQDE